MAPSTVSHGIFKAPLFDTDPLPDVSASRKFSSYPCSAHLSSPQDASSDLRLPLAEYPQPASNGTTLNAEPLNQQVDGHQADSEDSDDGAPGPSSVSVQIFTTSTAANSHDLTNLDRLPFKGLLVVALRRLSAPLLPRSPATSGRTRSPVTVSKVGARLSPRRSNQTSTARMRSSGK